MKLATPVSFILIALLLSLMTAPMSFAQETNAQVMVVHASPDAPAVDVYVNGEAVLTNVAPLSVSDNVSLPSGEHTITITPAGASPDDAILNNVAALQPGTSYYLTATGMSDSLQLQIVERNLAPLGDGIAQANFYHFSPDVPTVTIAELDSNNEPFVLLDRLEPGAPIGLPLEARVYTLAISLADDADGTPVRVLDNVPIESGMVYDMFILGLVGDDSLKVVTISTQTGAAPAEEPPAEQPPAEEPPVEEPTPEIVPTTEITPTEEPTPEIIATPEMTPTAEITPTAEPTMPPRPLGEAWVRFVNASPDGDIDIYVNREYLGTSTFFHVGQYQSVPAGEHFIQLVPSGEQPGEEGSATVFENGRAYTVSAIGFIEDTSLHVRILSDNVSPIAPGNIRLSLYHFSPDAPAIDVKLSDGTVIFQNLAYGSGAEVDVPSDLPNLLNVIVTRAGTDEVLLDMSEAQIDPSILPTVQPGLIYDVFAVDTMDNLRLEIFANEPLVSETPTPQPTSPPLPTPIPTVMPTPTPAVPIALPETAAGTEVSTTPIAIMAALLLLAGATMLLIRRRITTKS